MTAKSNTEEKPDDPPIQFNIRVPHSLMQIIQKYADDTHRSKVGSGIHLLEMALKAEGYER